MDKIAASQKRTAQRRDTLAARRAAGHGYGGYGTLTDPGGRAYGKSYNGDPDRGFGKATGNGVAGHAKSGSAMVGAAMGTSGDVVGAKNPDGSASDSNTRVICTELVRQGLMAPRLQRLDIAYTLKKLSPTTVKGYHFWAVPYVRLMKKSSLATSAIEPFATWRALEIAYLMGDLKTPHMRGRLVRLIGEPLCLMIGWILEACEPHKGTPAKAS